MDKVDLDIPEFLRLSPEARKEAWERQPPKQRTVPAVSQRAFRLPKTLEPEGLKLFEAGEKEAERKKAERLEALKALPKLPRKPKRKAARKPRAGTRRKGKK